MDIILPVFDNKGGGAALATSVEVNKAESGDSYGTVNVDASVLLAFNDSSNSKKRI